MSATQTYIDPAQSPSDAATELLKTVTDINNAVMLPINVIDIAKQLGLEYTTLFCKKV